MSLERGWTNKAEKYPGYFITFEGIDGSGKSTQAMRLHAFLTASYGDNIAILVREPGSEPTAEKIRQLIKSSAADLTNLAATLLFEAARAQLVERVIVPALERGAIVICDRYVDSTTVYQSMSGETPQGTVLDLNYYATGGLMPNTTFLLNVPPEVAIQRVASRREATAGDKSFDFFDSSKYARLASGYTEMAHRYRHRVVTLNGDCSVAAIEYKVWTTLTRIAKFSNIILGKNE